MSAGTQKFLLIVRFLAVQTDGTIWICSSCGAELRSGDDACARCRADPGSYVETCRIERWRGYVTSSFYAVSEAGLVVDESQTFRWRRAAPPPETGDARAAYDEIVAALTADGWTPVAEPGPSWFAARFTRPVAASPPVPVPVPVSRTAAPPPIVRAPVHEPVQPRTAAPAIPLHEEAPTAPEASAPRAANARRLRPRGAAALAAVLALAVAAATASFLGDHTPTGKAAAGRATHATKAPPAHMQRRPATATAAGPARSDLTARAAAVPARVDLRVSANSRPSWLEIRSGSSTGKLLYSGTLAEGQELHYRGQRLWARFGSAGNVAIVIDGKPLQLTGTAERLFTARR